MNVSELFELTFWIEAEIVVKGIVERYRVVHRILKENTQANAAKQPFETEKDQLIDALESVPLAQLSMEQISFLDNLNLYGALGEKGKTFLEEILFKNIIDEATSVQKFQEIIAKLDAGIEKANSIRSGLVETVTEEEYEQSGEILMRVSFLGNAALSNVAEFKNWGGVWYDIGRGITMLHGTSPEEMRIIGATRGSIVIEFAVASVIAATFSSIIIQALKVAERVMDIRIKAEELRSLKLKNDNIAKALEKEVENEKLDGIERIADKIIKQSKLKTNEEGDKINVLRKSIKNLVEFVQNGGKVDFVMQDEDIDEEESKNVALIKETKKLRESFEEIRRLESNIALLTEGKP